MLLRILRVIFLFPYDFFRYYKQIELSAVGGRFAQKMFFFKSSVPPSKEKGLVLVQMVKDYEFTVRIAGAAKVLAEKHKLGIVIYDAHWSAWKGWSNLHKSICDKWFLSGLSKIYLHFGDRIVFRCEGKYHDQSFVQQKLNEVVGALNKPADVLTITFEGVLVGDLIYDHYLRHYHQPTITDINEDVKFTIEVAINIFYNFRAMLSRKNIKALVNTYTSYLHHGIPARLCLDKNIDVYSIGSYSYVVQQLSKEFPYHQINHTLFSPEKKLTEAQLNLAKEKLTSRFEGKIDAATSYMRTSAFSDKPFDENLKTLFASQKRNVVIYVHDFYDSPHVNRKLQFPDLFQFIRQTLIGINDIKDTNVFIKTHPNGVDGCKEITIDLVKSLNNHNFHILDENISNLNVIDLRPDLIVTARGTVCLEMAYFEIPTVALYDNLYTNFGFTHTCSDIETFFKIIKGEQMPVNDHNKEKIFSFYYQAFLDKTLHGDSNIFNTLASFKGDTFNDKYMSFVLSHSDEIFSNKFIQHYSDIK